MACYDCEDCNKHNSRGGKCPLWAYNCPLDKVITDEKEREEIKNTIEVLNKQKQFLEDKQKAEWSSKFDDAIILLRNAVEELEEILDEEMLELHRIVYEEEYK